ncbi:MAG: HAMP domain-containing protein, partial [Clostridiales bacterium]|nr:HAMP domain-containing protein [Clostridiales bacterium]
GKALAFHESNQSFEFFIEGKDGSILFSTPNANVSKSVNGTLMVMIHVNQDYTLRANSTSGMGENFKGLAIKALAVLALMLMISVFGALAFARQMTQPIKQLAQLTQKMANLEDVPKGPERKDELGALAADVHYMYGKLKDEIKKEREIEETQAHFFSAASHELKTPIAAMSVILEAIDNNVFEPSEVPEQLRLCRKMVEEQGRLVGEILGLSSLETPKVDLQAYLIKDLVESAISPYLPLVESRGQTLIINAQDTLVVTDSSLFQKAFSNILLNAIQNTPTGGRISVFSEERESSSRLCVLNEGARILEELLLKLFEPFFRQDKSRNRADGRSGLGLTIVKRMLTTLEVPFGLENAESGVLFWMEIPVCVEIE